MPKFVKVSEDEAHNLRKDAIGPNGAMVKGVPVTPEIAKANSWKPEARTARFVMSAEVEDRMGDVVVQEGLDITNFSTNPQALLFHNSRSWPIGKWANVTKILTGRPKRTEGDMILLPEGDDPDADRAARHLAAGTMKTVSIGFRPNWSDVEAIQDEHGHFLGLKFNKSELLECSLVPIPALPAALMKDVAPGMLSKEALELIEMTLDTFAKDPRTGLVVSRDALEAQRREAVGQPTFIVLNGALTTDDHAKLKEALASPDLRVLEPGTGERSMQFPIDLADIQAGTSLVKNDDGTITLRNKNGMAVGGTTRSAANPSKPTEEEQGVEKPDPAAGEKQKTIDAVAIVREHARESREPGLFARLLSKLMPASAERAEADPVEHETPPDPKPEPVKMTDEEKAALRARADKTIQAATTKAAELNPA